MKNSKIPSFQFCFHGDTGVMPIIEGMPSK